VDLYLIRHADAIALGDRGISEDEERPLSEKGTQQARALGALLKRKSFTFDRVISSPLVRARQTAELLMKSSGLEGGILFTDTLCPDARPKKLSRYLMKTNGERVALVGHLPHLGEFASWVVGDRRAQIEFAKGGMALISTGDSPIKGNGVLHWLITPEWYE